jgi:alkylation response protein AidB-like acyl-CoA dehydrogenase
MCLTEAEAGSDVGAVRTRARPEGDHYLIEGEKIFITFGEHDLTENIVHLVLARIEGAPAGTRGISLFVVPKYRLNRDGSPGEANDVTCVGIEHKLGIHGSPTCTMSFGQKGNCRGHLVGDANQGMRMMFQMMNEARISVGLQGAALANAAYQAALGYSRERLQGSDAAAFKDPDAPRVPIIRHPDVSIMLLKQKAYAEGSRAFVFFLGYALAMERAAADEATREAYRALVEILTPVCKAYCTDMGFRAIELAIQCHGGYGYLRDFPVEQYLRDAKIASLYEGTNGIQALDLVGRKLALKAGAYVMTLAATFGRLIDENLQHPVLAEQVKSFKSARDAWAGVNMFFAKAAGQNDMLAPVYNATTYLSLTGDLVLGYLLVQQALISWSKLVTLCQQAGVEARKPAAVAKLARENAEVRFYFGKLKTAQFFCASELPNAQAKASAILINDRSAVEMVWAEA